MLIVDEDVDEVLVEDDVSRLVVVSPKSLNVRRRKSKDVKLAMCEARLPEYALRSETDRFPKSSQYHWMLTLSSEDHMLCLLL